MGKGMNDNNETNTFFCCCWLPGLLNIHVFVEVENKNRTEQKALLKSNLQSWSLGRNMCLVQSLPNTPRN